MSAFLFWLFLCFCRVRDPTLERKMLGLNKKRCWVVLTLIRAGELCSSAAGWRPGCIGAEGGTDVMPWARTSGVERGYGGPK